MDICRALALVHQAVSKVQIRFPEQPLHQDGAKSIAVFQILGNLPVTLQNVASLMHSSVMAPSKFEAVKAAVEEMVRDPLVPLGDKDGTLVFLSEKLRDIEQERSGLALRSVDVRRIFNDGVREVFDPLPRVNFHGTLAVASGIKVQSGGSATSLAGEQNAIQTIVELVFPDDYETAQTRLVDDSRSHASRNVIGLMARTTPDLDDLCNEIFRCQRIPELHRNDAEQEIRDY